MHKYTIKKLLNIPDYKVSKIDEANKYIRIWLEPYERKKAKCGKCGKHHKKGYHSSGRVTVKDLDISGRKVYLIVLKRRYECPEDGCVHTEEIEWLKLWGRVTRRYAEHVSRLTAITTNQEAGWFLGMDDQAVYRIDKEILGKSRQKKN